MARVALSIGSNLGDRQAALQSVLDAMGQNFTDIRVSQTYETAPWGVIDQPAFLNAIVLAETQLDAYAVLAFAQACEDSAARVRDVRWGPRTLDVDVILYDDLVQTDPVLTLPHPRAHERAFVLVPLVELDPEVQLPGLGRAADFLDVLGSAGVTAHSTLDAPA